MLGLDYIIYHSFQYKKFLFPLKNNLNPVVPAFCAERRVAGRLQLVGNIKLTKKIVENLFVKQKFVSHREINFISQKSILYTTNKYSNTFFSVYNSCNNLKRPPLSIKESDDEIQISF